MALTKRSREKYFSMTDFSHYNDMHSVVYKHLIKAWLVGYKLKVICLYIKISGF